MAQTIKDKSQIEILLIRFYNHLNDYKNESSSDEVDINMVLENFEELQTEILQAYEKEINARDKLEIYRHNRLKKNDVEVKVWCHSCERWVTDDITDCYCRCTCNFGEDSDYDCIYEEDINAENDCPRNKEWSWQYEISEKQYESLED